MYWEDGNRRVLSLAGIIADSRICRALQVIEGVDLVETREFKKDVVF